MLVGWLIEMRDAGCGEILRKWLIVRASNHIVRASKKMVRASNDFA